MSLPAPDPVFFERRFQPVFRALGRYHRFSTIGMEHVPRSGPALLVGAHTPLTYEIFIGLSAIYDHTGRITRGMADRAWFRWPALGDCVHRMGGVEAGPAAARAILEAGELLAVAPGGMREALRLQSRRFQIDWAGRKGFVRLAIETGVPVILAVCPAADLALTVYRNPLSRLVYDRWRQPLLLARGLGPTLLPRPIRLTVHFSPPIDPGPAGEATDARVDALHAWLTRRMEAHLAEAVALDGLGPFASTDGAPRG
jgi:1-acyl-sn-glycerol-3-phosphate acyltransferase